MNSAAGSGSSRPRSRLTAKSSSPTAPATGKRAAGLPRDRKSTRLNSSHLGISYAVFCLKKKKKTKHIDINRKKNTITAIGETKLSTYKQIRKVATNKS